jgi:hypothetical protein
MISKMGRSIIHSESESMDLNFMLSPFFCWMEVFGVRPCPPKGSKFRWFCWFLYRWGCFLLTIAVITIDILYLKWNAKDIVASLSMSQHPTKTFSWNVYIDYVNTMVHIVSTHLFLFLILFKNWNGLQDVLHQLRNYWNLEYQVKVRKMSIVAIIYIIILVSFSKR